MKKLLSLLVVGALTISLCACGGDADASKAPAAEGESAAEAEDTADSVDEPVEDGGQEPAAGGVMPAIAKEDIKVGVIHITDPAEGSGYTYTHDLGIQGMQKNIGLEDSQIVRKNNVNDTDATAIENAIRECIEEGCNVIFATSWGFMDTCEALADEFPEVIFSHGTGYKSNGTNFNNYFGRIYQARYLAGVAAGLKTQSNKLGYVAAMGQENSEVTGGVNAFAMGAYSVNPDCEVYVKVTNSWFDPEGETQAAQALVDLGCDVIAQHCDTPNPQTVAEQNGVWGVGYNSDMAKDAPGAVLTSVMWDWSVYYTQAVQSVIDGTWSGENYFGGMADGLVNIAELSDLCAEGTKEAVEAAREQITKEGFNVFDGVIETNDGSTVGEEGGTLSDADITGNMNWYFKNVVVK
ncbi:BMP family ABC transporter substrate-binding protein [Lachnospiraceae bacterium]|jgi:basic membrane protein A|nr:BMP family ABC transporter substrate-binding protein [Lachnospiraceae bacterium]